MLLGDKGLILVTGASGFLGSYLADACRTVGHPVLGVDCRPPQRASLWADFCVAPCESASWERFLENRDVRVVFHLAGSASVPDSVRNPYEDFATSVPGTARLLSHLAQHHPSTHLVFFSSAAVYGNPKVLPIDESTQVMPISPYGIHKATSEYLLQHYARLHNLRTSILRVFSAFGPGLQKQFFWDLGKRAFQAVALGEKSITLHGTGQESRDFVYVTDIAKAALQVASRPGCPRCEVFNVGSGRETTTTEAASLLVKHLGADLRLMFNGAVRHGDPLNWCAETTKLSSIGFRPEVSLSEGITKVATWLKQYLGTDQKDDLNQSGARTGLHLNG